MSLIVRRAKVLAGVILAATLAAACAGSAGTQTPGPTAVGSTLAPLPTRSPAATLPPLPSGWIRSEVVGDFSLGLPGGWLVLTKVERDAPAAADAAKARFPTHASDIDTMLAFMRTNDALLFAVDISGEHPSGSLNLYVVRVPGQLDESFATHDASVAQSQFGMTEPPVVQPVSNPAGSFRYDFAQGQAQTSRAGIVYLLPADHDIYQVAFLSTVGQIHTYDMTVTSIAQSFVAVAPGPG